VINRLLLENVFWGIFVTCSEARMENANFWLRKKRDRTLIGGIVIKTREFPNIKLLALPEIPCAAQKSE
jgi:hypothetical protein